MSGASDNPYVGPRSFSTGEALHGRAEERAALLDLLVAERVVLLHSPSGAGKSSLLQAGLVPDLRAEGFHVRPMIRVGTEPPASAPAGVNRYVLSVLLSLEEGGGAQLPLAELAALDLATYLDRTPVDCEVLIFDQFEEVLTSDPGDREAKHAFFHALGAALRPGNRWAVVAMREDHVASLAPYVRPLPNRLRTTFRLDLLGVDAALAAVQLPARERGVDFRADAARKLVDDLRQIQVQTAEGGTARALGPHVEPVQLQVICRNLWARKAPDDAVIDVDDVVAIGDVDRALTSYYDDQLAAVAAAGEAGEREIRAWFERALITEQGLRGQVLRGKTHSQGLHNRVIGRLIDTHIVRAEQRRGMTWFELAHDRMIGPVRASNARWVEEHLSPTQRHAELWDSRGRPEGLLLADLADIHRQLERPQLSELERVFLEQSRTVRQREADNRRLRKVSLWLTALTLVGLVVTLGTLAALYQTNAAAEEEGRVRAELQLRAAHTARTVAQRAADKALARQLAAELLLLPESRIDLAALLALAANDLVAGWDGRACLHNLFAQAPHLAALLPAGTPLRRLAVDSSSEFLAGIGADGKLYRWARRSRRPSAVQHTIGSESVVFDAHAGQFVTGNRDGSVGFWDPEQAQPLRTLTLGDAPVRELAVSADGARIATIDFDNEVRLWATSDGAALGGVVLDGLGGRDGARPMRVDASGDVVAVGGGDGAVWLWRRGAKAPERAAAPEPAMAAAPFDVAIADGGVTGLLADGRVVRWPLDASGRPGVPEVLGDLGAKDRFVRFERSPPVVLAGGLASDGGRAATVLCVDVCTRELLAVWDAASGRVDATVVHFGDRDERGEPFTLVIAPKMIALAGTSSVRVLASAGWRPLIGHQGGPEALALSADGRLIATGGCARRTADGACEQGELRIWDRATREPVGQPLRGHDAAVVGLTFFAGAASLASIAADGSAVLWDMSSGQGTEVAGLSALPQVNDVRAHGEKGALAAIGWGSSVVVWDLVAGVALGAPRTGPTGEITSVAIAPDGARVAAGSCAEFAVSESAHDAWMRGEPERRCVRGAVHVWDVASGAADGPPLLSPGAAPTALSFAHTSPRLASISEDGSGWVWDLRARTGKEIVVEADGAMLAAAAFSHDDQVLATLGCGREGCGQHEGELRLWVSDSVRALTAPVQGHDPLLVEGAAPDRRVAFMAGDAGVVTISGDGASVWPLDLGSMRTYACALAGRNFGADEWARHVGGDRPFVELCPGLPGLEGLPRQR